MNYIHMNRSKRIFMIPRTFIHLVKKKSSIYNFIIKKKMFMRESGWGSKGVMVSGSTAWKNLKNSNCKVTENRPRPPPPRQTTSFLGTPSLHGKLSNDNLTSCTMSLAAVFDISITDSANFTSGSTILTSGIGVSSSRFNIVSTLVILPLHCSVLK